MAFGDIRTFYCKRCNKKSHDKEGGFSRYDTKNKVNLIYENIDLCPKCFKITKKDQQRLTMIQKLMQLKILNNEEDLKRFQTDKQFRNKLIQEHFIKKKGDTNKKNTHPPSYYNRLNRRKAKRELEKSLLDKSKINSEGIKIGN